MFFSGIEKTSLVDFDGYLACTVFTQGCNFKCPFCQNSDLVIGKPIQEISEEYVLNFLTKRKGLLDAICITGGEPTLQKDLKGFIKKVKEIGLLVKLDTNGTNPTLLNELIQENLVDYVAMDVKNSFSAYPLISGYNGDLNYVKTSIDLLLSNIIGYEFRTTLVNGYHTEESIEDMAKTLSNAEKIFLQKFEDKGSCLQQNLSAVPLETAEKFKKILQKYIKNVFLRGY